MADSREAFWESERLTRVRLSVKRAGALCLVDQGTKPCTETTRVSRVLLSRYAVFCMTVSTLQQSVSSAFGCLACIVELFYVSQGNLFFDPTMFCGELSQVLVAKSKDTRDPTTATG